MEALKEWAFSLVETYGLWGLFGVAFIESSFFPVPPDVILIGIVLTPHAPHTAWVATVCTVGSVLGAILGWVIGAYGGYPLLHRWFSEQKVQRVEQLYNRYGVYAVFVAAFTPIPYKVFTIASGVFRFNIVAMLLASIVGRGARFFLVAYLTQWFGREVLKRLDIAMVSLLVLVLLFGGTYAYWRYRRREEARSV
ncbi:MAG: YqaA family protein [Armatimonadota bacterium]|nr:DedA family protein [bacterium]MDW8322347.1 YqaA family protein [Armatimonadota bacterium]